MGFDIMEVSQFFQSGMARWQLPKSPKARILIVDDDPCIRESLGMLLTFTGYEVGIASNGATAVSYLMGSLPDLIVTDLNMPEMSGLELIAHVHTRYPSISVIAMSGDYQAEAGPASIMADRFYPKGQHPHHLLTTIASLIAAKPSIAK
jgi:CheY-like chemotaxis protein